MFLPSLSDLVFCICLLKCKCYAKGIYIDNIFINYLIINVLAIYIFILYCKNKIINKLKLIMDIINVKLLSNPYRGNKNLLLLCHK